MIKPVAYLHHCKQSEHADILSFEAAVNPQWTSEPLYTAARIEALEAALRCVIDNVETGSYESTGEAIKIARAALDKDAGE